MNAADRLQEEIQASGLSKRDWYHKVYLESDHWRELRAKRLQIDGHRCTGAGNVHSGPLQVHHLRYRHVYDVSEGDLQTLCTSCHRRAHRKTIQERRDCRRLKMRVPKGAPPFPPQASLAFERFMQSAPPSNPGSQKNWAINQVMDEMQRLGLLTPNLKLQLRASKSGKGARAARRALLT